MPRRCYVGVAQETVRRNRFAPAIACFGDAARRLGRKSLHQFLRSPVKAGVAKIESSKFILGPLLRYLHHAPAQKTRVNAIWPKFTRSTCKSLNVNVFSRCV